MTTPAGLVKVRGQRRGAGWAIGTRGVLTAAHVAGSTHGQQCLVVPHAARGADTHQATVIWADAERDLTLLQVTDQARWDHLDIARERAVLAEVGAEPLEAVAIGFPDAALVSGFPSPSTVLGWLLPAEQLVAGRMPLDARTATPEQPSAWAGMSGAAVRDRAGRLLGIITQASTAHQNRRLLMSPLPEATPDSAFATALAAVGATGVIEDARANLARELLAEVDQAGKPPHVGEVPLHAFGVRRARSDIDRHSDDYFPYVPRQVDAALDAALARRADRSDPRLLLVVGESMAGTSRCAAEAVRRHDPWRHAPLLRPHTTQDLPRVLTTWPERPAVLWLEGTPARSLDHAAARSLTNSGPLAVIVVLPAEELRRLQDPPHIGDAWRVLTDETLVEPIRVPAELEHATEREALEASSIGKAVARHQYRLAEYLGAGQELLLRLEYAPAGGRALVDLAAEWRLAGTPVDLDSDILGKLWPHFHAAATGADIDDYDDDELRRELRDALTWATARIAGTRSVLRRRRGALIADTHVILQRAARPAKELRSGQRAATAVLWTEAIQQTAALPEPPADVLAYLAVAGADHGVDAAIHRDAIRLAASLGSGAGCLLEGISELRAGHPAAARRWWEAALTSSEDSSAPHVTGAHLMLGMANPGLEPAGRLRHLEAAARCGHTAAAAQLGVLLMGHDDVTALRWLEEAANEHGDDIALFLGILLSRNPDRLNDAERWLRSAASAGQVAADFYLAQLLAQDPARTTEAAEVLAGSALLKDPNFQLALADHPMFAEQAPALRAHALAALGENAPDDSSRTPGAFSLPFDLSLKSRLAHFVQNPTVLLD